MLRFVLLVLYLFASYSSGQSTRDVAGNLDPNGGTAQGDVAGNLDPDG